MYILEAIASASREVISTNIKVKMIRHSLKKYQDDMVSKLIEEYEWVI